MLSSHISQQIYAKLSFEATFNQKKIIEKLSEWVTEEDYERIFLLNGYAGTGKTTTLNAIIEVFEQRNALIQLAAPTGRAAKRMSQVCGMDAMTIHRLLGVQRTDGENKHIFTHDEENPLDMYQVSRMLGHSSTDITERVYADYTKEAMGDKLRALNFDYLPNFGGEDTEIGEE